MEKDLIVRHTSTHCFYSASRRGSEVEYVSACLCLSLFFRGMIILISNRLSFMHYCLFKHPKDKSHLFALPTRRVDMCGYESYMIASFVIKLSLPRDDRFVNYPKDALHSVARTEIDHCLYCRCSGHEKQDFMLTVSFMI